jgi:predicted DCC family thiol-disulfide oxidoreductase YuxK
VTAPARPVLLYDDGCRFCRACARLIHEWDRAGHLYILPWSHPHAAAWLSGLDPVGRDRSIHLRDPDGHLHSQDEAVLRLLSLLPGLQWLAPAARRVPRLRGLLWRAYQGVARHRGGLSRISPDCTPLIRYPATRPSLP